MKKENQEQRHAQWRSLVQEQQQSGLAQKEFCKQRNVALARFVYYRCKFKDANHAPVIKQSSFTPVKVTGKESAASSNEIKLSLPNGFQCSFPSQLDAVYIKRLVEVLLAC